MTSIATGIRSLKGSPARFLALRPSPEALPYLALMVIAGVMRFWDLGTRAMHHDESLHAFFALDYLGVYKHNPLMHGPFQFFGLNVLFNIFGASDTTARALAALFGIALVGMPYFLRDYLGRWGGIIASGLLAFSPTILYFSRFTRNDIFMAVWALGLVICAWRYLVEGRNRYLYIGAAILGLSFSTKENAYITLVILASFFFILWLRRSPPALARPKDEVAHLPFAWPILLLRLAAALQRLQPYLIPSPLLFLIVAGWVVSAILWSLDIYDIFGRVDLTFSLVSLGVALGLYFAVLPWLLMLGRRRISVAQRLLGIWRRARLPGPVRRVLRWPALPPLSGPGALWLLLAILPLPLFAAAAGLLQGLLGLTLVNPNLFTTDGRNADHKPGFPDGAPVGDISLAIAIAIVVYLFVISVAIGLKWSRSRFIISGVIFWGIFILLYTTLFTNLGQGLGSGIWQGLGYWLAQQEVSRGAQPWYYYMVLSATYEFLPLTLVLAAGAWYFFKRRGQEVVRVWILQALLASVSLLLLLSPFWMPDSSGQQLAIGVLLLLAVTAILCWFGLFVHRPFLRSRPAVLDAAVVLLFILNWVLPRMVRAWDSGALGAIWDVRGPLTALVLLGALASITFKSLRKEAPFTWFLLYWLGASLVLYSSAGEKMPWLMVHVALPLSILAARLAGHLLERVSWRPRLSPGWGLGVVGALVIGVLTFHSMRVSVEASYGLGREGHGDVPIEMLVYTQTSPDITDTMARIEALGKETGLGRDLPIIVDRTSGFEYPWRWYLREYRQVRWPCYDSNPDDTTCRPLDAAPNAYVLIIHYNNEQASMQFLGDYDGGRRIRHRSWFPEFETYKRGVEALPVKGFFKSLVSADAWEEWWNYFAYRKLADSKPLGSEDSVVFFRRALASP